MSATNFTPAVAQGWPARDDDRDVTAKQGPANHALRDSRTLFFIVIAGVALCAFLRQFSFTGEGFQFSPAPGWLRVALGVVWLGTAAVSLLRVMMGRMPGPAMVVFGIFALSVGRLSFPPWQTFALGAISWLAFRALGRSQQAAAGNVPASIRRAVGGLAWLVGFGVVCISPADTPGTVKQLGALLLGTLFLLPISTALKAKAVSALDRLVKKGWKAENILWVAALALLTVNVIWKSFYGSSVPQMSVAGISLEPFETARAFAVSAFALSGYRWARRASGGRSLPPLTMIVGALLTIILYFLLREKGTLALVVAGFALTWATQVGGRSTLVMWLSGGLVLGLILFVARERLAVATGQVENHQAEAALLISSHLGLIGAVGAARPTAFLGPASTADFMLTVVAAQSGLVGLALVLTATLTLFVGLFQSLWHLKAGAPRALGITAFAHILLPAASSLLCYSSGLVVGLPFPFLARGGNHLLLAMAIGGLLLALGSVGRSERTRAEERDGVSRMRLVLVGSVALLVAVALLVLVRVRAGWEQPLAEEKRRILLNTPARLPYFHGPLLSADGIALAATQPIAGGRWVRIYRVDEGLAPVIGAGTDHVQDSGVQARAFWMANGSRLGADDWLFGPREFSPQPETVSLTLRADWSRRVTDLAREHGLSGAVLVVRRDGAVEVALSLPGYEPNRTSSAEYLRRLESDPRTPFLNRAFHGVYPVGSVIKPPEAWLLIDAGLGDAAMDCDGSKCSGRAHGTVRGVEHALRVSCNLWFQRQMSALPQSGWKRGLEAAGFGLLEVPGAGTIGLPLPDGGRGVPANEAIGQGQAAATPINIAASYLPLLNGGRRVRPFLVERAGTHVVRPDVSEAPLFSPLARERVLRGMRDAAASGTASTIMQTYKGNSLLGAKTGTAETGRSRRTHALFVAATRTHVVIAVHEHGGKGASLGPLVGHILNVIEGR